MMDRRTRRRVAGSALLFAIIFGNTLCFADGAALNHPKQRVDNYGGSVVDSHGIEYVIPPDSPVNFSSTGKYGEVLFAGRFVMSGTYHYGYLTNDPTRDASYDELDLYFVPDRPIAMSLPYWKGHRIASEIRFTNVTAFARAVVPDRDLMALKQRRLLSVSGRAKLWVNDYRAWVECDYPTYEVRFLSIYKPSLLVAGRSLNKQFGC